MIPVANPGATLEGTFPYKFRARAVPRPAGGAAPNEGRPPVSPAGRRGLDSWQGPKSETDGPIPRLRRVRGQRLKPWWNVSTKVSMVPSEEPSLSNLHPVAPSVRGGSGYAGRTLAMPRWVAAWDREVGGALSKNVRKALAAGRFRFARLA